MPNMVKLEDISSSLLQKPPSSSEATGAAYGAPKRREQSVYKPLNTFVLEKDRQYQQQYGDMYFLRLTKIKPAVDKVATEAFGDVAIGGEPARKVERVLDVRQGELCWVSGTVYIDMPLKPNILEDVAKDRWISAPSFIQKYFSDDESRNAIMLEDDSGRVRLVGDILSTVFLVTGCIIAVMGTENASGDFEVIDLKFPDLAPQPERWTLSKPSSHPPSKSGKKAAKGEDVEMSDGPRQSGSASASNNKIAIVSGLNFSGADTSYATELALLLEFLLGEALDPVAQTELAHISRLIIAGNSIASASSAEADSAAAAAAAEKKSGGAGGGGHKKYGYDSSSYNPVPSQLLDEFLSELLPSMPVTFLPGAHDPANSSFPQQPIHPAMFPRARSFGRPPPGAAAAAAAMTTTTAAKAGAGKQEQQQQQILPGWFDAVTNPWEGEVDGWRILGTSGQNVDDVFKYVDSDDRLGMMEAMCRWRCSAPTAPDTLWSYPFQDDDPFVMMECPHLYFVGNQPEFGTSVIAGPDGQSVRLVAVPAFSESREIVLVDSETLDVTRIKISTSPSSSR